MLPLRLIALFAVFAVAACSAPERPPVPVTPAGDRAGAPVVRTPLPEAAPAPPVVASAAPSRPAVPKVTLPPDAIYVCVVDRPAGRDQTVIEFAPKVYDLCKRHPEMGPCQYERNQCRSAGGRVYARGGVEITLAHEAEYDKKVMRVRFRAN
jgi:hypothetical protein